MLVMRLRAAWMDGFEPKPQRINVMSAFTARHGFALLCALGMVIIGVGALLEASRFRRGASVISPRQFRLRMLSAALWIAILAALFCAVVLLWPQGRSPAELREQATTFLMVVGGAFSLILVNLVLFAYDLWQLARERRAQEARLNREFTALANAEVTRLQRQKVNRDEQDTAG
jgi:hypothetical protein